MPDRGRIADAAGEFSEEVGQEFPAAAPVRGHGRFRRVQVGDQGLAHHRLEQFRLVLVIEIERALGHTGAPSHLVQAGGGIAPRHEFGQGRFKQFLGARLGAALPAGLQLDDGSGHGQIND
jgi:hypothetical protein